MTGKGPFDRVGIGMLAVFTVFVLGSGVAGMLYADWLTDTTEHNVRTQLTIIAEEKERQVGSWYTERLGDARYLFRNAHGRDRINVEDEYPLQSFVAHDLPAIVMAMYANKHYRDIMLFDTSGRTLFSTSPHRGFAGELTMEELRTTARKRQITFHPQRPDSAGRTRLDLVVPIYDADNPDGRWVGTYVLVIDPDMELLPIVRFWPVTSGTAVCMIAERAGADSVQIITATSNDT